MIRKATEQVAQNSQPVPAMEEKHYKPAELAAMWGFSTTTIRRLIADEPDVLRLQGMGETRGKRPYTTYSIPASVAARVHERLSNKPLQAKAASRTPRRVVLLRDRHRGVA